VERVVSVAKNMLHWDGIDRKAKAHFSIEHIGSSSFEVEGKSARRWIETDCR